MEMSTFNCNNFDSSWFTYLFKGNLYLFINVLQTYFKHSILIFDFANTKIMFKSKRKT